MKRKERLAVAGCALLLVFYLLACLDGLTRLPIVHGDEMWNAAPAWKLATTGVYGSDLFAGFYRAEDRTYQFMPILQLLLAADFKLFGVGLLQIRMLSVVFGATVLLFTYFIGRRVGGARVGLLAVWILTVHRLASGDLDTGIVLLDLVRQTRYHIVASAFGLASLLVLLRTERERVGDVRAGVLRERGHVLSGALAGLAYLSHMYGAFWVLALLAVLAARHGVTRLARSGLALCLGFALAVLPWIIYVLEDVPTYLAQMRMYADRFALLDPWFYVDNVVREHERYHAFGNRNLSAIGPGTWLALAAFGPALVRDLRLARASPASPRAAVVIALLVITGAFAVLLKLKTFTYLLTTLPLAAVVLADAAWALFDRWRAPLAVVVAAVLVMVSTAEAATVLWARHQRALSTTPYDDLVRQIAVHVPRGATVVVSHRYWLGLRDRSVRTWLLPLFMSDPITHHAPISLNEALTLVDPDVLVLDDLEFGPYFASLADPTQPRHAHYVQLRRFLQERGVRLSAEVRDPSYRTISIYVVPRTGVP